MPVVQHGSVIEANPVCRLGNKSLDPSTWLQRDRASKETRNCIKDSSTQLLITTDICNDIAKT